jgi:hypothetical protein
MTYIQKIDKNSATDENNIQLIGLVAVLTANCWSCGKVLLLQARYALCLRLV